MLMSDRIEGSLASITVVNCVRIPCTASDRIYTLSYCRHNFGKHAQWQMICLKLRKIPHNILGSEICLKSLIEIENNEN